VFEEPFDWEATEELALEQRVIGIDLVALRAGDPRQNIVVRDRDVFHVPVDTGVFYIMGEVQRPGVYSFGGRDITIKQAMAISGGFTPLAWPSRCELIRREPGTDKQFTRLVNLDAIFAGLEDDLYLRDDDIVNVGTHIVAPFLFVIRNSFRFTYGFGFVYDRNFADKDAYSSKVNPEIYEQQRRQQRGLPF
jgi:protein involved in polysaccharide export with SLBB domain